MLGLRVEPLVTEVPVERGGGHEFPEVDSEPEPCDEFGGGVTDEEAEGDGDADPACGFAVERKGGGVRKKF